jgi:toxin secretion/phage lysis holin
MDNAFKWLSGACFSLLTFISFLLGGWDAALSILFLLMGLDILTGLVVSVMRKSARTKGGGFLSSALFLGLTRKLLMLLLVILGTALDGLLGTGLCRVSVIGFYSANEAFSIIENAAVAGLPFPKGLLGLLERYRDTQDTSL